MPKISMTQFARFYEARPSNQPEIVQEILRQRETSRAEGEDEPSDFILRYFYGVLYRRLQRTHWSTGDIDDFARDFDDFIEGSNTRKQGAYREIGEAYIEHFVPSLTYVRMPSGEIDIGGLRIGVWPEIGIHDETGSHQALKLWLNISEPSLSRRQVLSYAMTTAAQAGPDWPSPLDVGIWDIRRRSILRAEPITVGLELAISAQAAAFLYLWESLEE